MLWSKTFILIAVGAGAILLGRGAIAFVLGWAFPGLGHWWLGERRRGLLVGAGVLGLFLGGLLIGGIDAVDQREDGPWFLAQAWNGPIAFVADFANERLLQQDPPRVGELIASPGPALAPGGPPSEVKINIYKGVGVVNDIGMLYIALGGLMNLVAMLDAASRARRLAEEEA
ncbi:MAG: hypothetical protein KF724_00660 [Phycisphaeraceae bacterium]|nr:hypothetical protein [Phycisphaeraceae bacterium]